MRSPAHKRYTVNNNINATNNLLVAIVASGIDTHVVHLGTMGVYGYGAPGVTVPEGYLRVRMDGDDGSEVEQEILYPPSPGSVYHMTKTQDQLMFAFYNRNDEIRITDLHQGIVWGTQTPETVRDERLINRFDYDGDYGTVLNRFLMQAAIGFPLTVHGTGGQTRAFIHIRDTVRCVELAVTHPPESGDRVRIFNQMTETHRLIELARLVSRLTGTPIDHVENPRKEAVENELRAANRHLLDLGLQPITLEEGLLREVTEVAQRYAHRCDRDRIPSRPRWTEPQAAAPPTDQPSGVRSAAV
jgi:UDP-sulfoquinovose synthase